MGTLPTILIGAQFQSGAIIRMNLKFRVVNITLVPLMTLWRFRECRTVTQMRLRIQVSPVPAARKRAASLALGLCCGRSFCSLSEADNL